MRKVICYYQVDLAGDITVGCGTDWTLPVRDGRRTDGWNMEAASQHTKFMVSRGAVGMRMCEWGGLNEDRPVGNIIWLKPLEEIKGIAAGRRFHWSIDQTLRKLRGMGVAVEPGKGYIKRDGMLFKEDEIPGSIIEKLSDTDRYNLSIILKIDGNSI